MNNEHTPAPESWEEEFDQLYGDDFDGGFRDKLKDFISRLLASREAAARREAAERAVEYIETQVNVDRYVRVNKNDQERWDEILDAARSEGVNG